MADKPQIQYVGQFYVYGSEAPKLEPKIRPGKKQRFVPAAQPSVRVVSIDPVAAIGLIVAIVMLASLVLGALQISTTWQEYDAVSQYLAEVKRENSRLEHNYRTGYDLAEIEAAAIAIGMVPATEVKVIVLDVEIPQPEPEPTVWEDICWFMRGLFSKEALPPA